VDHALCYTEKQKIMATAQNPVYHSKREIYSSGSKSKNYFKPRSMSKLYRNKTKDSKKIFIEL